MTKIDAILEAHAQSKKNDCPYYAIERKALNDWYVSDRKPSLRSGNVIECYDGRENLS
jgi:hypothetical protein